MDPRDPRAQSGSFQLNPFTYKGAVAGTPNPNPELLIPDRLITQKLNLYGTYKLTLKGFNLYFNVAYSQTAPENNLLLASAYFVSPNVVSEATNTNFVQLPTTNNVQTSAGMLGSSSINHVMIADIKGKLDYNVVIANPWFGAVEAFPAINPYTDPYVAGGSPSSQPYWATTRPTRVNCALLFDYERIN